MVELLVVPASASQLVITGCDICCPVSDDAYKKITCCHLNGVLPYVLPSMYLFLKK